MLTFVMSCSKIEAVQIINFFEGIFGLKKRFKKFNAVLTVLALMAAFSLMELPFLHSLYHQCHETAQIGSAKKDNSKAFLSTEKFHYDHVNHTCPICAAGGVYNQLPVSIDSFELQASRIAAKYIEPDGLLGTKFFHARQRAPPLS
jgi:hypothetical protein